MYRELLYPIFMQVYLLCENVFWKSIFNDIAHGDMPYEIFIDDEYLYAKDITYYYKDKPLKTIETDIINIYNSTIFTDNELEQMDSMLYQDFDSWTNIKKKSVKDVLIEKYILLMGKQFNIPMKKLQKIYKLIILAINFKIISNHDIYYNTGTHYIDKIAGIDFSTKTPVSIHINSVVKPSCIKHNNKLNIQKMWSNKKIF
jgi:hypothetical protein